MEEMAARLGRFSTRPAFFLRWTSTEGPLVMLQTAGKGDHHAHLFQAGLRNAGKAAIRLMGGESSSAEAVVTTLTLDDDDAWIRRCSAPPASCAPCASSAYATDGIITDMSTFGMFIKADRSIPRANRSRQLAACRVWSVVIAERRDPPGAATSGYRHSFEIPSDTTRKGDPGLHQQHRQGTITRRALHHPRFLPERFIPCRSGCGVRLSNAFTVEESPGGTESYVGCCRRRGEHLHGHSRVTLDLPT